MQLCGFNKTTLLDYPGHLASTIFIGGCNFRCPFCHNASLVLNPADSPILSMDEVFHTLQKRKGIIEGVCITGGEPTLYPELVDFIQKIKKIGLLVKLDTNGNNPKALKELVSLGCLDYVAMDIKNSKEKYGLTVGIPSFDTSNVSESISYLLSASIDYEFRTTVVKEFHSIDDFVSIGEWIQGAKAYFLQSYKDSEDIISQGLSSYSKPELDEFREVLLQYVPTVSLRGVD